MANNLIKQTQKALSEKTPESLKAFLGSLFESVTNEDLSMMSPASMVETAERHLKFSQERKPKQSKIYVSTSAVEGEKGGTIIDIVSDDTTFLVDSIAAEITRNYKLVRLLIHPMLHIQRDKSGKFTGFSKKATEDTIAESHIHIELQGTISESVACQMEKDLQQIISDVYCATKDWQAIRKKLRDCQKSLNLAPSSKYSDEEIKEYLNFLEYMHQDNFTLLGFREYKFQEKEENITSQTIKKAGLGLLGDDVKPVYIREGKECLPQPLQRMRHNLPPLTVSKVNKRSTVHRSVPLDAVAVKQFDLEGHVVGECLFIGLFTSVTYSRSIQDIPFLSGKTESVLVLSGFKPGSHDHKALRHVLEKYPRDELFQISEKALLKTCLSILRLQERQRIALYTRSDPFGRYVSCLVYVPRERYDTRLRLVIQHILEEELKGYTGDFYTNLDDSPLARLMFTIYISQKNPPKFNVKMIEKKLKKAGRRWGEKLNAALTKTKKDEAEVGLIVQKYGEAFPVSYHENYLPKQAVFDIEKIEEALKINALSLDLHNSKYSDSNHVRLKVFHPVSPITLSAILPILGNMGLRAISEIPFEILPGDGKEQVWIQDFFLESAPDAPALKIKRVKDKFEEALTKIWYGEIEDDSLNKLVLSAEMGWRDIIILRAYVRYMRQMGYHLGTLYIEQALTNNAKIAKYLTDLFKALHDPEKQEQSDIQVAGHMVAIDHALKKVESLDEDRILRSLTNLIESTLRTNYFQRDKEGQYKPCLSFKLDCSKVKDLPKPIPYREIFVYSPRVEALHLRADVIARGGIRWSDRHEDFRTEVLGLMKAQQVKNSVIVPMGAKGGFIVKNPPTEGGRDAFLAEGIECYKIFIRGLLDITDNRKGNKVIKPVDVLCRDGDDPYLVVAADKGTATFSDIANSISLEYGHWLGDAFASGGSAGYDHKEMGITARGAWESVKRLFRELNHDIQTQDFDVVGVGDMGGDVFGNGLLRSKHIKMIGAFNHMHIFCDPTPDPAGSFKERKRLFNNVKGWGAYDRKKLSKGGRIYSRSDKSLALTPEIQKRFDLKSSQVTPAELIQALLKARTDLLWFGGIGTYIKASYESNEDVGDKSGDALRVNAGEIRAHIIGEGANLAVTHSARIEFAQKGGKINADFIDNSGGVDSSDHEVNIKILTTEIMAGKKHKMTLDGRNKLLEKMTEEIEDLVLRNNYQQVQAISLMELRAGKTLSTHAQLIRDIERNHGIDRKIEGLPDDEEIEKRLREGKGLTRPELSVLQAYAKIFFSKDLLDCDIPDLPEMQDYWLVDYFPHPLREKYRKEILGHRLRREIVTTTMSSSLINRMGPTFVKELMDKTGASCADVARAYLVVRDTFNIRAFWDKIEALDNKVPAQIQLEAMRRMATMIARETIWFLTRLGRTPDIEKDTRDFGAGITTLQKNLDSIVPKDRALSIKQRTDAAVNDGLPKALARQIALISTMGAAFDIIRISMNRKTDLTLTARVYFELGEYFHIDWLREQAKYMTTDDRWSSEALEGLVEELHSCQAGLTNHVIQQMGAKIKNGAPIQNGHDGLIDTWVKNYCPQALKLEPLFTDIRRASTIDIAMLLIAEQRLRGLYGG